MARLKNPVKPGISKRTGSRKPATTRKSKIREDTIDNLNPATMEVISSPPVFSTEQVDEIALRAREAQKKWAAMSLKDRSKVLKRFMNEIAAAQDEIVDTICKETGKTEMDGRLEVFTVCEQINYVRKKGPEVLKPESRSTGIFINKKAYINYRPLGVVGIISPWNYPLVLSAGPVIQALMAGNAAVIKPSEITPDTTLKLREVADRAGIDKDLFAVVTGGGSTGAALVESQYTDMICFTGSTATGRKIGEYCGKHLKPVILELGGKDPMIVFRDANLERAANGALWGGFSNSGQTCIAVERILVEESIHDQFVEKLRNRALELKQGFVEENPSLGSMTFAKQTEIVESHLNDAEKHGADFILRGRKDPSKEGLFFQPSIVADVNPDMKIWKEETFGPMVAVMKFKDETEAIELANNTAYGLNSSVWTRDSKKAKRVAASLESGSCCINDVEANYSISDLPFGGVKESGIGKVHGVEGLRNFTNAQAVCMDRTNFNREFYWFPYSTKIQNLTRKVISFLFG